MKSHRSIIEMILFAMFGAMMFAAKVAFEFLPNIHPVAMFIMVFTVVYRVKALIPVYVFVAVSGLYYGFATWWLPYLYIWTAVWLFTMLVPKRISDRAAMIVYPIICGLSGLLYGTLYAPAQALLFGYDFPTMIKWIAAGLPFDALHGLGNIGMGLLVLPLSKILKKLNAHIV